MAFLQTRTLARSPHLLVQADRQGVPLVLPALILPEPDEHVQWRQRPEARVQHGVAHAVIPVKRRERKQGGKSASNIQSANQDETHHALAKT